MEPAIKSWKQLGREAARGTAEFLAIALIIIGAAFLGVRLGEHSAPYMSDSRAAVIAIPLTLEVLVAAIVAIVFTIYRNSPSRCPRISSELTAPAAFGAGFAAAALATHGLAATEAFSNQARWISGMEGRYGLLNLLFGIAISVAISRSVMKRQRERNK